MALDRARAAVAKQLRRLFEEALLAEHDRDEKWMCPIGYGLFRDPVRAGDGHVYERSNIVKWQEKSGAVVARPFLGAPNKRAWKSPMTGLSCHDFALAPAAEIRSQIDEKLDEMMRAERAKPSGNENGEGAEDGGDDAHPARGSKAKGKAKAAPRRRGRRGRDGSPRGAKRAAEGRRRAARATRQALRRRFFKSDARRERERERRRYTYRISRVTNRVVTRVGSRSLLHFRCHYTDSRARGAPRG